MATTTPSSFLRINNIVLRVPPESISIIKNSYNANASTLRSQSSTRSKSGRKDITIIVNTFITSGYNAHLQVEDSAESWINGELAPLLIQVRKCPFVSIENEKIRKVVLGKELGSRVDASTEATQHINMAATVKSITATVDAKDPDSYQVQIVMQYFNYSPFSPDFTFRDITEAGRSIPSDTPTSLFDTFVESGTMNGREYVNAINPKDTKDLELFYKEYQRVGEGDLSDFLDANVGWVREQEFESTSDTKNITISRYKRFVIANKIDLASGSLILESGTISLQTKVPSIPLNGHMIPTAQFLGCSDGIITLTLFANANFKNERPVGTSSELAKLNRVMDTLDRSTIDHHRVAKNDTLLIKHPLAKLLKYKVYDEESVEAYDEDTQKLVAFNPNECLGCIVENTTTQTVDGLPYCSRTTIQLVENWRSNTTAIRAENVGGTARVYEATQGMLIALANRYGIERPRIETDNGAEYANKFVLTKTPALPIVANQVAATKTSSESLVSSSATESFTLAGAEDKDYSTALKLTRYLTDSIVVMPELITAEDFITNEKFLQTKSSEFSLEELGVTADTTSLSLDALGGVTAADVGQSTDILVRSPLSYDRMNEMVSEIIKETFLNDTGTSIYPEYQPYMEEFNSINKVQDDSTYPDMILPRVEINGENYYQQPDFYFYNFSDTAYARSYNDKLKPSVEARLRGITEHFNEQVGDKDASRNYNDEVLGSPGPPTAAPNIIAHDRDNLWKKENGLPTDKEFAQNPLDFRQQLACASTSLDHFTDTTYSMRRAMPTFKLYVKEDDYGSLSDLHKGKIAKKRGIWRNFASFYDMNALIDIRLVKDKDNPADLLIVRMMNTKEDIVNKSFSNTKSTYEDKIKEYQKRKPDDPKTVEQLDLNGVMIKEGTRVELRLGYDVDPNNLSVEFSGRIARVGGGDVVELVCQGDGIELVQELKGVGVADEYTFNSNTLNVITKVLENSLELKNFGSKGARTALGELDVIWNAAGGRTVVENIFAPSLFGSWDNFADKTLKYLGHGASIGILGGGIGILVGAAIGGAIGLAADIKDGIYSFFRGSKFVVYEQTIWEILQELTLRHPGTICGVVPFDRRSTIFFGYPDQLYFFRGPTFSEALNLEKGRSYSSLGTVELNLRESLQRKIGVSNFNSINPIDKRKLYLDPKENSEAGLLEAPDTDTEKLLSFMKPYRNYHLITSQHDIIDNSMMVNSDDVYNSIQIVYPDSIDSDDLNFDGSNGFSEYKKTDEIKADDDLNFDYIKRQTMVYHNAHKDVVKDLPEKYSISLLCRSLSNVYKGKIKILGRNKMKPHDIVFVYDTYNNISGPIEISNLVQTFSYDTGWVTEITPGMIVQPTTSNAYNQIKTIERAAKSIYLRNSKLFYSGILLNAKGQLINDVERRSKVVSRSQTFIDAASTGGAYAASGIVAGKIASELPNDLRNAKTALKEALNATTGFKKAVGLSTALGGGVKFVAGRIFSIGIPILGDMALDYLVGAYVNWSRFRQPIIFLPVQRNGKPWYTGLHGIQNNTEWEAIKGQTKDIINKADFLLTYLKEEFAEVF